jgi:methyl-accepting chemotaxis protein
MPSSFGRIADTSKKLSISMESMKDALGAFQETTKQFANKTEDLNKYMKQLSENTKNLTEETKLLRESMGELTTSFNTALKSLSDSMAIIAQYTQFLQHPSKSVIEGMGDNMSKIISSFIPKKDK